MKHLIIIGARGWGREIFNMLPNCHGYNTEYEVKGFLDDKSDALDETPGYPPIIDSVEHYTPMEDDVFVCAMGDTHWKKHYSEMILAKGGKFINIIHKSVSIERNTLIGIGCIMCKDVEISCDARVGNFITFQAHSSMGHDSIAGDYCHFGVRSFMGGYAQVGDFSILQTACIILPHIKIGKHCTVGAGAVVIKKVKDFTTVYGNPAKKLMF